jgi:hypothetical protein
MSGCNVCLGGYDIDGSHEFYEARKVKARKPHKCHECRRQIEVGEVYEYVASKYDGDFSTTKTCLSCSEIQDHFACKDGGAIVIGELWSEMRGYVFPNMTIGCLDGLSAANKQRVIDKWQKWKGLL